MIGNPYHFLFAYAWYWRKLFKNKHKKLSRSILLDCSWRVFMVTSIYDPDGNFFGMIYFTNHLLCDRILLNLYSLACCGGTLGNIKFQGWEGKTWPLEPVGWDRGREANQMFLITAFTLIRVGVFYCLGKYKFFAILIQINNHFLWGDLKAVSRLFGGWEGKTWPLEPVG